MTAPSHVITAEGDSGSFASSLTVSVDLGTGTDRTILVEAVSVGGASASVISSITAGGVALTLGSDESLLTQMGSAGRFRSGALQGATLPAGTQNIVITASDGNSRLSAIITVYSGTTAVSSASAVAGFTSFTPSASASASADQRVAWMALTSAVTGTQTIAATSPSSLRIDAPGWQRLVSVDRVGTGGSTAAGYTVTGGSTPGHSGHSFVVSGTADTTPPTLTTPTGAGGTLTCSGTVTTDEAGGTLSAVVTGSASAPSVTQIEAGQDHTGATALRAVSQSVTATGLQSIASGSVTAGTRYIHYVHRDAAGNVSAVSSSSSFVVSSGADTTPPTLSGSVTVGTVTSTSIQTSWPAGTDNVAVTSYETSTDGTTWTDRGAVLTYTFTGLTASTSYTLRVRAKDAAGNVSSALSVTQSTSSGATPGFDLNSSAYAFKDNTGTLVAGAALTFTVHDNTTGALIAQITGFSTNGSGLVTTKVTHASLAAGTMYSVNVDGPSGVFGRFKMAAA